MTRPLMMPVGKGQVIPPQHLPRSSDFVLFEVVSLRLFRMKSGAVLFLQQVSHDSP